MFATARLAALVLLALCGAIGRAQAATPDELYRTAADHYQHQRWQAAIDEFARLIAQAPDHERSASARFYRGEALMQLERYADAGGQFDELVVRDPKHRFARQAQFRSGEAAFLAGDLSKAREKLRAVIDAKSDDDSTPYALEYLARIELDQGRPGDAEPLLVQSLARGATGSLADECRLRLALVREELGKQDLAREEYRKLVDANSPLADTALLRLAALDNSAGNHAEALAGFETLATKYPESPLVPKAQLGRGYALYKLARHDEAEAALLPIAKVPELGGDAHYWLGMSQLARNQWSEAAATFQAGRAAHPEHRLARAMSSHAARALGEQGQTAEAAKLLLETVGTQSPDALQAQTCTRLAEQAFEAGDLTSAESLYELLTRGGEENRDVARGLLGLAWCRFRGNDWTAAATNFDKLLRQFPDDPHVAEAALARGRALEHLQDVDGALLAYGVVYDQHRDSPRAAEALDRAARIHDAANRSDQAVALYARVIAEHPQYPALDTVLYRAATLQRAAGQSTEAEALFARLAREFPNSQLTPDATLRRAEQAIAEKKYDEARGLLTDVTREGAPPALRERGLYLTARLAAATRAWTEVDAPLQKLVAEFPDSELTLPSAYLRAEACYRRGEFVEASKRLEEVSTRTGAREQTWYPAAQLRRAQSLAQQKQWDAAIEQARQVAQEFSDADESFEAEYVVGRALAAQADLQGAREAYARVIASPRAAESETAAMARWMIGESYFHQENYAAALAEYEKVDAYPFPRWQAAALLQSGKCRELSGDWQGALDSYKRLAKRFPESELNAEAARRAGAARDRLANRPPTSK